MLFALERELSLTAKLPLRAEAAPPARFLTTFLLSVPADFNLSSFWNFLLLFLLLSILICVIYVSSELI